MSNLINSPKLSIEKILNDPVTLEVPAWQRFYSWTSNEVEEFWYDITHYSDRYSAASSDYFIGTVLIVTPANIQARLLLDGQQRMATSVILLSCLKDAIRPLVSDLAAQIELLCLQRTNYSTQPPTIDRRIRLTDQDDAFFERHIIGGAALTIAERRLKPSQRLLWRARAFFVNKIDEERQQRVPQDFQTFVVQLQQRIRDNVVAIAVTMDNEDNAISVFETLNDRGVGLSTSELVRAYLLQSVAAPMRPNIIQQWQTIFDLEGQPRHKNLLRHLWISEHGDVKARALSKTIKEDLDGRGNLVSTAVTFATEMADKATRYADLVAATVTDPELNDILREVGSLGAQALYPALLSAIEAWPAATAVEKQATRGYARALVNGYVRHVTIGEREGTKLEKLVYGQAKQIFDKLLDSSSAIAQIKAFVPTDPDFQADFKSKSVTSGVAQYILRKFENALRGQNNAMQVAAARNAHVEHIYPQNPAAAARWSDHDEWVNRIGNLTLLAGTVNRGISNSTYAAKRPVYRTSGVLLTEQVAQTYSAWTQADIKKRQTLLSVQALNIWSV